MLARSPLRRAVVAALLLTAAAAPLRAEVTDAPGDDIVVQGERAKEAEVVRGLARDITANPPVDKPVPRFIEPVCFGATGISRAPGLAFVDRMIDNARVAGVKLGGDGCNPNVLVAFVGDGAEEIRKVRKQQPGIFTSIADSEIKRALAEPGPAKVLSSFQARSESGEVLDPEQPTNKLGTGSRISLPVQSALVAVVVLIDRRQALGKTLQQLADYATLRALATTRPSAGSEGFDTRTMLSLFAGEDPPEELTGFDRAYLRALYATPPNARAATLASAVAAEYAKGRN
jgi:hypothetical protein